jgi:glycosyltransferase involved in cell wall biosynthesis
VGGIEYHVEALSRRLAQSGHKVVVYTSNEPRSRKCELIDGVEILRFNPLFSPLNNPVMPGLFLKLLRSREFDIVHAHGHFHISSCATVLSNVLSSRPIVLSSHGAILGYQGLRRTTEVVFNKTVGRWTLGSVDRVIALSPSQAVILGGLGAKRERISVIPGWVDLDHIDLGADAAGFRRTHNLEGRRLVLFVGRLLPIKGLTYLIQAAKLANTRPAVVIIGGEAPGYGGTRQALELEMRQLGLERDVFFLGRFAREELGAAYLAADIFVLPSLGEGMPLALLEAMAYGKCVLASRVPGNQDVVKDGWNGLLVGVGDSVELADKIDYLLRDSALRERLGRQARRDIEQDYDSDVILGKIMRLYREIGG